MKRLLIVLVLLFSFAAPTALGEITELNSLEDLVLENIILTLDDGYYQISGVMKLTGNSSLTIINA